MKYNSTVTIKDTETILEEEEDRIEVTVDAAVEGTESDYTIEYDEFLGDGLTCHTIIRVTNGKCATIIRSGSVNSELTVEYGKRHLCHYITPYGEIMVGINAKRVESTVSEHGGSLHLSYTLDLNGCHSKWKEMTIDVYPKRSYYA